MATESAVFLSVVVPVFNEAENVAALHREIVATCQTLQRSFEIIFVDDGSTDGTLAALQTLVPVTIVALRRNAGQTAALDAGIKQARGEVVVTLDGDGQNDPADIPLLLAKLSEGCDVVSGWRKNRRDPLGKKISSRCANILRQFLIADHIHDSGCTLKAYRRECFAGVDLYGEMHRFIPALLKLRGFQITEVVVNHRSRQHGVTKYTWKRGIKGVLDMVSVWFWKKYANRPLHLFGGVGMLLMLVSGVAALFAFYQKFFAGEDLSDTALTMLAMFGFFSGVQLIALGLVMDVLAKNYYAVHHETPYAIRDVIRRPDGE